jgi:hypothetical protein
MIPATDSDGPFAPFRLHLDGATHCFLIGALLITAGFHATLFLREIPLRRRHESGEASVAVEA